MFGRPPPWGYSFATLKTLDAEFKHGRTSLFDETRPGRRKISTDDRRLAAIQIAKAAEISSECVHSMRILSAQWVPLLTGQMIKNAFG